MSFGFIDILFLATVALLVFNGLRNGALFSIINLIGIPIAFGIVYFFGPRFTQLLAANGLSATPLISYIVLFFGSILILHIIGTVIRGVVQQIPVIGFGDALLGGVVGFIEAWLIWLILLLVLGSFLQNVQGTIQQGSRLVPGGLTIQVDQFRAWHDFYNEAITKSLFAQVNSFFIKQLPGLPQFPH
ncbi:CvpA family protein [Ktedonosporobacter rubrisoli]|uniref:CvpA family protein n=1 Tax=Ktedonosporobacter rubrisoli TaxID=2509675 RepID=A0A4P6JWI1_KTERU|nr:CvpA family protein [Ktedonosporobacter rubrisoli]QBD79366.1 CvpA family protein [Ktedonosporobacter rubrisoli]